MAVDCGLVCCMNLCTQIFLITKVGVFNVGPHSLSLVNSLHGANAGNEKVQEVYYNTVVSDANRRLCMLGVSDVEGKYKKQSAMHSSHRASH